MAEMDDASVDLNLPLQFQDINEPHQNANRINDRRFVSIFGEAPNPQELAETVAPYEESSEDYVPSPSVPMLECVVCGKKEAEHNAMKAPCGDIYCGGCVNDLFSRATDFEINFPPKCCGQVIPLEATGFLLSWPVYKKFQEKSEEFGTTDRTYCYNTKCGTFIPRKTINDNKANCPACHKPTCVVCKEEAHEGDCLNDLADESLMTAAAAAGFQQCGECKRMIELSEGCHHITCICGHEFCYLCGAKWKTCACEFADEANLMGPGEAIFYLEDGGAYVLPDEVQLVGENAWLVYNVPNAAGGGGEGEGGQEEEEEDELGVAADHAVVPEAPGPIDEGE